ncbi:lipoprotein localization protein LolB [Vibrio sp. S9_S30]|uniref:lipoprotein insertase outer membrane protein LolB n=1 Tax=Vibrio sp. S9_S30 TaxID=2720226 RepID=UPI00168044A6|nr:lipoprotein insertase outer membrane protein LolB [Vibrio sp. S9_S30]MBD1555864.1 lipoprotein localization protein LolB [Vibrio sp. S9_S30]
MTILLISPITRFIRALRSSSALFVASVALLLSACTTLPEAPNQPVDWVSHQKQLESLQEYALTGKMAYISESKRQSLNFYWKKTHNSEELRLTTLLGQTALLLNIDETGATVVTHKGETYRHVSSNILIKQLTGLSIPIVQLSEWIKGLPLDADAYQLNNANTLSDLTKQIDGQTWNLNFNKYTEQDGFVLPSSLTLVQDKTKLKIAVSKWIITQ